jgi:hypothetical protein
MESVHKTVYIYVRNIQVVSKILGQTSSVPSSRVNKGTISYKDISANQWFLYLNWRSTFKNKYHSYVIFYSWYISIHVPNVTTVEFWLFIKSQSPPPFQKYSKCPPSESMHTWTRLIMDTSDYGLTRTFIAPGAVRKGLTGIKNVLVKCRFIFNRSWVQQEF